MVSSGKDIRKSVLATLLSDMSTPPPSPLPLCPLWFVKDSMPGMLESWRYIEAEKVVNGAPQRFWEREDLVLCGQCEQLVRISERDTVACRERAAAGGCLHRLVDDPTYWAFLKLVGGDSRAKPESEADYQRRLAPLFQKRKQDTQAKVEALVQLQLEWERLYHPGGVDESQATISSS